MAEKLVMLALSPTMEKGTITRWLKREGDAVHSGDALCEVETDKATMEYETTAQGVLLKILAQAGSSVALGETIAIVGKAQEDISALLQNQETKATQQPPPVRAEKEPEPHPAEQLSSQEAAHPAQSRHSHAAIAASPLARHLAREKNIDLSMVYGTGPGGRVVKSDIDHYHGPTINTQLPPTQDGHLPEQVVALSQRRRVIAQRLSESYQQAPHYFLRNPVCADALMRLREEVNSTRQQKLSLNAFLIKLSAHALTHHPLVNASWAEESIIMHERVDIALAVAHPQGLITPVVRDCHKKGIAQIDTELKELITLARENHLKPEQLSLSTFSLSNLGSAGIREFTAIINPPAAAILAVGELFREPFVNSREELGIRRAMVLTLSCDHRVLDGAVAAAFFAELKEIIENPALVLI